MSKDLYIFWDLQTGGHSHHVYLDDICDMLLDSVRYEKGTATENEDDNKLLDSFENGEWTEKQKIDFIENHEYKPEKVSEELLERLDLDIAIEDVIENGW